MELHLTPEEHELLTHILEENYRTLVTELRRTDSLFAKQYLRDREHVLESLLSKLGIKEPMEAIQH